jgi:hypothetical protein
VVSTVDARQQFGGGERYVWYLLLKPIPRIWWSDKPHELFATGIVTKEDVADVMGWTVATGAAPTLVADWYREWGIYSLLAWIALGAVLAILCRRAIRPGASTLDILLYVLVLARSLNLLAQGFIAFVEPLLMMIVAAYAVHQVYVHPPVFQRSLPVVHARRSDRRRATRAPA